MIAADSDYNRNGLSKEEKPLSTSLGVLLQTAKAAQKFKRSARRARTGKKIFTERIDTNVHFVPPHYPKSEETFTFLNSAVVANFIFCSLNDEQRCTLVNAMSKEFFPIGAGIISQGGKSDFFYIVEQGIVEFYVDWKLAGTCSRGESIGELSLLYNCPSAAFCITGTDCTMWKVDRLTFCHILAKCELIPVESVCKTLKRIPCFHGLNDQKFTEMVKGSNTETFEEGQPIVTKGKGGQKIHIIREGKVKIHNIGYKNCPSQYVDYFLGPGDFFGEEALCDVTALSNCTTLSLSRHLYEKLLGHHHDLNECANRNIIQGIPIIANLKLETDQIYRLCHLFTRENFLEGEYLVMQGEPVVKQGLYIIQDGRVVITNDEGVTRTLLPGDYFGDGFLKVEEGSFSKKTVRFERQAICSVLSRRSIESVIGEFSYLINPLSAMTILDNSIKLDDIEFHRIIGVGSFSTIRMVSHKQSKKPYALKMMCKYMAIEAKMEEAIICEKNILASIHHSFIVSIVSAFQDDCVLYFLLDFIQGGELFTIIHSHRGDGILTDSARFYAGCILEALSHLHHHHICYRNLIPENLLIDKDGYCVLVNFKYAKVVMGQTYTFCGTPEYLAPEIILQKGHNTDVDYWAFGVLIYEMLQGENPFYELGMDQVTLFKRIVKAKYSFPLGVYHGKSTGQLISSLLTRKQANRIGHIGDMEIRSHEWFSSVDFAKILKKKVQVPWLPVVKGDLDPSNFEAYDDLEDSDDILRQSIHSDLQKRFYGF